MCEWFSSCFKSAYLIETKATVENDKYLIYLNIQYFMNFLFY